MGDIRFCFFFAAIVTTCLAGTLCTSEEIADGNVKKLAAANNELAIRTLLQLASQSSENIFFSPLSLSTAFGMLYHGTKGETAKDLSQTLGYDAADLPEELVHPTFQRYLTETLPSQDPDAYVLNSANAAILDKNLDVYSSYEKDIQAYYQATVKEVDFTTSNQEVVQDINNWVKDKTIGKIDKLLDELDPSTVFVLLNAIYFKGSWKTEFDKSNTRPQKFYNNGIESEAKEIPMMKLKTKFRYNTHYDLNMEAIEMPYKGENISMIILLPHQRDGLGALQEKLSLETLKDIQNSLIKTKATLTLPKFKVEYSKEMSSDFKALGATSIFSPGADFSGMTKSKNVYVSQVLHKAVIEVSEEGSEAAAVTGIISNRMRPIFDPPPKMVVDHPFIFAIVDKRNDMILFLGRVTNL